MGRVICDGSDEEAGMKRSYKIREHFVNMNEDGEKTIEREKERISSKIKEMIILDKRCSDVDTKRRRKH